MGRLTELGAPTGDGEADWDIEAFLKNLQDEGALESMRGEGRQAFLKRKEPSVVGQVVHTASQDDTSASEPDDWDRWTSTEDAASTTTCAESDWGSERDLDGQAVHGKAVTPSPVPGRWGLQSLVGGASANGASGRSDKLAGNPLSDSCDSLPYLDGEGNLISMMGSDNGDGTLACRGPEDEQAGVVKDSELDAFLAELEQNEKTSASSSGWKLIMNKSTTTMKYCSWFRDPGIRGGTEYRGRMVVEGISAETARDFLLDEAHRAEWDENRLVSQQLEEWDENGNTVVRWIRRLPFFLRNREYVVARRVWNPEHRTFYCISRNVAHPSAPPRNDLVRVSSFYSSWRIRPVKAGCQDATSLTAETDTGVGSAQAVEVITHHEEESGLQKDLAKMGVAHGMWGHLQRMEQQMQAYAASGKNAKHILPVFLIQADAGLGLQSMRRQHQQELEQHQQELEQHSDEVC